MFGSAASQRGAGQRERTKAGAQIHRSQTSELHWRPAEGLYGQSINSAVEAATVTLTKVAKYARKLTDKVLMVVHADFDMIGGYGCLSCGQLPAP
jgi:hypothetical protein